MRFLSNIRIGTRLAIGFVLVLALSIASTGFALIQARQNATETRLMMEKPLTKERITADWYVFIYSAIARTALIAKSTDATLSDVFADVIADSVKQGGALVKSLEELISSDDERKLYQTTVDSRNAYQKVKNDVMAAKISGDAAKADRVYTQAFLPTAKAYQDHVQAFLAYQRQQINAISASIAAANERSIQLLMLFSVLLVLLGAACAVVITRSITRPLKSAIAIANRAAEGDLTTQIVQVSKDEIGDLMRALETMNRGLKGIVLEVKSGTDLINNASAEIASGNLDLSSRSVRHRPRKR